MTMTLAGQIFSDTGVGLNSAGVELFENDATVSTSTTTTATHAVFTNEAGWWQFAGIADDLWRIRISSGGVYKEISGLSSAQFYSLYVGANTFSVTTAGAVSIGSTLTFTTAASKIIPGATSMSHRNNADSADNLLIHDSGAAIFRSSIAAATTILSSGTVSGVGYGGGAGGSVTQLTSRTTGVTLNNICGRIITSSASLAAGGSATFRVTNSAVGSAADVVILTLRGSAASDSFVRVVTTETGFFDIQMRNFSPTTADTTAYTINFAILKSTYS